MAPIERERAAITAPTVHGSRAERLARLLDAQRRAEAMFDAMVSEELIRPGVTERELSQAIHALARRRFGIGTHWHKRLVRSGVNTLQPFQENPPERTVADDDIVFVDLGPVFAEWEADLGRTYVLGADPRKHRLADDLPRAFSRAKTRFDRDESVTGEQLYAHCLEVAADLGWSFGAEHAGHLIGEFPHKRVYEQHRVNMITRGNCTRMRDPDPAGLERFWILEIHLTDPENGIGGFYEQLLTTS